MPVPPLDLKAEYQEIQKEVSSRVNRVLKTGRFILGPEVDEFERSFAKFTGTKYALGIASGSDAILLPLMAYDVTAGDEIITTPFTFIATATAIVRLGAKPVFADIEPDTLNIDLRQIEKKITRKTRGIIVVHLYGNPCNMDEIRRIAKRHKLFIIEDCAQACGSTFKHKPVGSFGDAGAFSFYPTKTIGAAGDAGAITTNDRKLYEKMKSLRHHGDNGNHRAYAHIYIGINSRLDELQAAVLNVKLKRLPEWNRRRRAIAQTYNRLIQKSHLNVMLPSETPSAQSVYHQYTLRVPSGSRDQLVQFLRSKGISVSVFYPIPLHLQPCFRFLGYRKGSLPIAETAASQVLSLPIYPQLKPADRLKVIQLLQESISKSL